MYGIMNLRKSEKASVKNMHNNYNIYIIYVSFRIKNDSERDPQRSRIILKSSSTVDDYKEKFRKALGADRLEVNAKLTIWLVFNNQLWNINTKQV